MKITIAYTIEDERDAYTAARQLMRAIPAIKIHKSDNKEPFYHLYLTTRKPGKTSGGAEND